MCASAEYKDLVQAARGMGTSNKKHSQRKYEELRVKQLQLSGGPKHQRRW